jgi:GGDEF domain-containing protein
MTSEIHPLQVVVVSSEVQLLHETSWMLEAVGYKVYATTEVDNEALWRRYAIADFVIMDGRSITEPTAESFAHDSDNPQYRLFLYDPHHPTDFAAWYAAGAHDALRTPVSRGELLVRLRTGARYLEFERRMQQRSARGLVPGMFSRRGLLHKLRKLESSDALNSAQHALLVTSIDWYAGIRRKNGETASRTLVSAVARSIRRAVGETAVSAYLRDGRFATLLVGHPLPAAKSIAESLAKDFCSRESHHELIVRPTLTSAVTPWAVGVNADRFLNDALETHRLAEHSGGDCVLVHGEFLNELKTWQEEMASGNPFVNVVAQDIMEPFPAVLDQHAEDSDLAKALHRVGVPIRPYVDRSGRLVGVATAESSVRETRVGTAIGPAGESLEMPETIPYDASFPEIYEAFSSRGCSTLVVTAEDHPLGYLTCDGFLSMIDPIHVDSFAHTGNSADELAYLVVPSSTCESAAVQPAGA